MSGEETDSLPVSQRVHASKLAGGIVLFGMGLVILARVLRPLPSGAHPAVVLLVGSLPNFGAGLGLPFVAGAAEAIFRHRSVRLPRLSFGTVCLGVLGVLGGWEYGSLAVWGLPVDMKDLLASGVGVGVAALIHATAGAERLLGVRTEHRGERGRPVRPPARRPGAPLRS